MIELLSFAIVVISILTFAERKYHYVKKNTNEVLVVIAIGTLAFLVFFKDIIFGGYQLSFTNFMYAMSPFSNLGVSIDGPWLSDPADSILPLVYEVFQEWKILLWSSSNGFGLPVSADIMLSPFNWGYFISMGYGQIFVYIMQYTLAFFGMYLFLKSMEFKKYSAVAGAVTYTFSSAIVVWGGWGHSKVIALAPFLFYAVEKLIYLYKTQNKENKTKYYVLFIVVLYVMLVVGMPTYVAYFMYMGIAYSIFRLFMTFDVKKDFKLMLFILISIGIAIVIAAMMSAPYIVELYSQVSGMIESRESFAFSYLDWKYLLGFVFPYYSGLDSVHMNERSVYSGLTCLFFFTLLPFYFRNLEGKKKKEVMFWSSAFIVIFLLIYTTWSGQIYQLIPLISSSLKIRILVLLNLVASVLTAYVVEFLSGVSSKKALVGVIIPISGAILCFLYYSIEMEEFYAVELMGILAALMILLIINNNEDIRKILLILLLVVVASDSAYFASRYLPLLEDEGDVVPVATESIEYLQNGTTDGERIAALGTWTLFPMTNMYYELDSITSHSGIVTNEDMMNYLLTIDGDAYVTTTRTQMDSIDNDSLLSYASVKYIYYSYSGSELEELDGMIAENGTSRSPILYDGSSTIVQEIVLEEACNTFSFLISTYGNELSDEDYLNISIYNQEGERVCQEEVMLGSLQDNSFYTIFLESGITEVADEIYTIVLEPNQIYEKPIALWITEQSIYEGECSYEGSVGDLCVVSSWVEIDGELFGDMIVKELDEYSPRVFVATDYVVTETIEESLTLMSEEYLENTAFITQEIYDEYELEISDNIEENQVISYEDNDNSVYITVETTGNNMLVFNDYFYSGWKAYIDGEEVEIEKVNYLFRGVYLEEAGEYEIVFKYFPNRIIAEYCVWGIIIIGLILMWIKRRQLDILINSCIGKWCGYSREENVNNPKEEE